MPPLLPRVAAFSRRCSLLPAGARVAAAVSGGSDSVGLWRVLLEIADDLGFAVAGLIHVNHQLRGEASDADERFCRALAEDGGRQAHVERIAVVRSAGPDRASPEEAARAARYAALERGRVALDADLVALGHTRDDQAETVLLRLLRGSGPDGLAGIPPSRTCFVRPLLEVSREELRSFLRTAGQAWVEDATNDDTAVPRNLVRHVLLPALEAHVPHAGAVLARHAEIAREEATWLARLVKPLVDRFVHQQDTCVAIDVALATELPAIQRRVLLAALRAAGVRHPGLDEVEALRSLLESAPGARDLPGGVRANRIGAAVVLSIEGPAHHVAGPAYRYTLRVPGEVRVPEAAAVVTAVARDGGSAPTAVESVEVDVDREVLGPSVGVRNWQTGDLIRPLGLGGRKKLQDVFVDGKLPRLERRRLPLVVDAEDHVLWVPGLALDERARVTSGTKAVVTLRLTRQQVGGPE